MNIARGEARENASKLAIPDQRFAADDRDVQRAMTVYERQEAFDEFVAVVVGESA